MQNLAHDYWAVWKQFVLHGVMQDDGLPPALVLAWRRCAAHGLDPYGSHLADNTYQPSISRRNGEGSTVANLPSTLLSLVRPAMEDLHQFAEGSECVVVFADASALIVDTVGDQTMRQELTHLGLGLAPGASWSEEHLGANALALALQESFPIQLDGPMHYCVPLHPLYTSAAPVHDVLGQAIGVLAVVGRHEQSHPHTLGMITAAAQALSNQLQMQAWLSNANNLLSELRTILQTLSEGILLLRYDGVISQMNAPAGTMLGLTPARVTGRKLQDVLPLPQVLTRALQARQALSYEEIVFDTMRGRLPYLCTLKPITSYQTEMMDIDAVTYSVGQSMVEPASADGFVLILRSIERVQKLVHRMTGAQARLSFAHIIGESAPLKDAVRRARLAANSNATVLLHGETGTGKEIFAQSIHNDSVRADGPFVAINCAAIPRELITTELFGYEGGAFTGADRQGRPGKFEQAHKGTLFLDEIGDMPLDLQANLLRAIETRTVVRIGGQRVISVDVRIIAATHKNLREEVQRGNFRSDLYYRLNVLTIEIPALRERIDDIPLLVQHFLQRQSRILERPLTITTEALVTLQHHHWPGNVRELENMLERVTHLTSHTNITIKDLPLPPAPTGETTTLAPLSADVDAMNDHIQIGSPTEESQPTEKTGQSIVNSAALIEPLKDQHRNAESQAILQAWQQSNGNIGQAAALLGISRTTLWRKMRKYDISKIHDV